MRFIKFTFLKFLAVIYLDKKGIWIDILSLHYIDPFNNHRTYIFRSIIISLRHNGYNIFIVGKGYWERVLFDYFYLSIFQ